MKSVCRPAVECAFSLTLLRRWTLMLCPSLIHHHRVMTIASCTHTRTHAHTHTHTHTHNRRVRVEDSAVCGRHDRLLFTRGSFNTSVQTVNSGTPFPILLPVCLSHTRAEHAIQSPFVIAREYFQIHVCITRPS
jgi:hypothetical protein